VSLEFEDLTGKIIGAAIQVHRRMGPGFLESIYEKALVIELEKVGLFVQTQRELDVLYDGQTIGKHRLDMLVERQIVVELKAIKEIDPVHFAVVRSYLRAAKLKHGLLLNYNKPKLEIKRVLASDTPS
jgi:GxxExxY protein